MTGADLNRPEFFQDPYPFYRQIRKKEGGVIWLGDEQSTTQRGVWLFARHADALAIFRENSAISKSIASVRAPGAGSAFDLHMLHRDAPDHLRLRRLVADYFSPAAIARLKSRVAVLAGELLDALPARAPIDLMAGFAEPLPLRVIADLMAVPRADLDRLRAWGLLLGDGFDSIRATPELLAAQRQALAEFLEYAGALVGARPAQAGGDLLSHLAAAEARGDIRREEVLAMAGFLLFAGHETTINLIGNGLWLLLSHRAQWEHLAAHPAALPGAIEEILRYESPEQRTSFRLAIAPLEIGGRRIEAGQRLGAIIGSANRDEAAFPDPDRFDIARTPNKHLAFGLGLHQCLGQHMARMEAHAAFTQLLARCPGVQLASGQPAWRRNSFFRGLLALPATLH